MIIAWVNKSVNIKEILARAVPVYFFSSSDFLVFNVKKRDFRFQFRYVMF